LEFSSHHATVEDSNAMLVVMKMLTSSDTPWASTTWTTRADLRVCRYPAVMPM
jgi:hypothetical protein